jgi:hypothetical protein
MPNRIPAAQGLPESAVSGVLSLMATMVVWGSFTMAATGESPPNYRGNCSDAGCHGDYAKRPIVHGPVAQEACDSCHEPVDGEAHKFTFVEVDASCSACHDPHGVSLTQPRGRITQI